MGSPCGSGERAAERHAGSQLQRALCEEEPGEGAGGRGAEEVGQPADVVGGTLLHFGE